MPPITSLSKKKQRCASHDEGARQGLWCLRRRLTSGSLASLSPSRNARRGRVTRPRASTAARTRRPSPAARPASAPTLLLSTGFELLVQCQSEMPHTRACCLSPSPALRAHPPCISACRQCTPVRQLLFWQLGQSAHLLCNRSKLNARAKQRRHLTYLLGRACRSSWQRRARPSGWMTLQGSYRNPKHTC